MASALLLSSSVLGASPPVTDGLELYLRADQGVIVEDGKIFQWQDQSGRNNHFIQEDPEKRPQLDPEAFSSNRKSLFRSTFPPTPNSFSNPSYGWDFFAEQTIEIDSFSIFDSDQDGLTGTITVQLYHRNDSGTKLTNTDDILGEPLTTLTFTPGEPGELTGTFRSKQLPAPLTLPSGSYTISVTGYSSSDPVIHSNAAVQLPPTSEISLLPRMRQGTSADQLAPRSQAPTAHAGSANFDYSIPSKGENQTQAALHFDGRNDKILAPETFFLGRPSTVFCVLETTSTSSHRILSNSWDSSWSVYNFGFHEGSSNDKSIEFPPSSPHLVAVSNHPAGSRWFLNGDLRSLNPDYKDGLPGRLQIGSENSSFYAPSFRVAALLAYDRILEEDEQRLVSRFLENLFFLPFPGDPLPEISSSLNPNTGNTTITINPDEQGASTRYTIDGTDPTHDANSYLEPFSVPPGTEIRAAREREGRLISGVATLYVPDPSRDIPTVPHPKVWLKADRGIETDLQGRIQRWHDLSGNENHFVQANTVRRPNLGTTPLSRGAGPAIQAVTQFGGNSFGLNSDTAISTTFEVTKPLTITNLGLWDENEDGFSGSLTVQLVGREENSVTEVFAEALFTNAEPGTLEDGYRYKALAAPIQLTPGLYAIITGGLSESDRPQNNPVGLIPTNAGFQFLSSNRGRINIPFSSWEQDFKNAGLPGSFKFQNNGGEYSQLPAVVFDGYDDVLWNDDGILTKGEPFTIFLVALNDRILSEGDLMEGPDFILKQQSQEPPKQTIWTIRKGVEGQEMFLNGEFHSSNFGVSGVATILSIGGSKRGFSQQGRTKIGEVLVYDRELSHQETVAVEAALSARHLNTLRPLEAVEINPPGGGYQSPVEVTLTTLETDTTIRYTLDGSTPVSKSPIYSGPIVVSPGTTVRARNFRGENFSDIISAQSYFSNGETPPVDGAIIWLDAGHGLEIDDEGCVSRWRDLSGFGHDFTQEVLYRRPQVIEHLPFGSTMGPQPVVALNDRLNLEGPIDLSGLQAKTVLIAFEFDDNFGSILESRGSINRQYALKPNEFRFDHQLVDLELPKNRPLVATIIIEQGENAFFLGEERQVFDERSATPPLGQFSIGSFGSSSDSKVTSFVAYDRVLSDFELATMQRYLQGRVGGKAVSAPAPLFDPPSGFYEEAQSVTIVSRIPDFDIRYTLDGSLPSSSSPLYQSPLQIAPGTTIRAQLFEGSNPRSEINSAVYEDRSDLPHSLSDPAFWLRADRGLQLDENQKITRWLDLSGHGNDLHQPEPLERPQFLPNGFSTGDALLFPFTPDQTDGYTTTNRIGTDFIVEEEVIVTSLGAYDADRDGFFGTIEVELHRVDDQGTPEPWDDTSAGVLATSTFTTDDPGVLRDEYRIKPIASPLTLPPGRYLIAASGYTEDRTMLVRPFLSSSYREEFFNGIRYPADIRNESLDEPILPGNHPGNSEGFYKAGTLVFQRPSILPAIHPSVSFTGEGSQMIAPKNLTFDQPSTVVAVFRDTVNNSGRQNLLRNSDQPFTPWLADLPSGPSGSHHHTDEPFKNQTPGNGRYSYLIHMSDPIDSQLWLNGTDLTLAPGSSGPIGRFAIGGTQFGDPGPSYGDLVELIIFDRVLSETETLALQASISSEYQLPTPQLSPPKISPEGGVASSLTEVSLSHFWPEAEIRYTIDGSDPDESSILYQGAFTVSGDTTIRAIAFAPDFLPSSVSDAQFFLVEGAATPLSNRHLETWLRSDIGVTVDENSRVTTWHDLSGNGMNAIQKIEKSRPFLVFDPTDTQPVLRFDDPWDYPNDVLYLPPGYRNLQSGLTVMFVSRHQAGINWDRSLLRLGGDIRIRLTKQQQAVQFSVDSEDHYFAYLFSEPLDFSELSLITVTLDPDGLASIFFNGHLVAQKEDFPLPDDELLFSSILGGEVFGDSFLGDIAEVLIFSSPLSYPERLQIEEEIGDRHNIPLLADGAITASINPAKIHEAPISLTLNTGNQELVIRYTTDGSEPDPDSETVTVPLSFSKTTRLRARSFANNIPVGDEFDEIFKVGAALSTGDGLLGSYFDGLEFTELAFQRIDPSIEFRWGRTTLDGDFQKGNFSARWTGQLQAPLSDIYQLSLTENNIARIWLDLDQNGIFEESEQLIDTFSILPEGDLISPEFELTAGEFYDLRIDYRDNESFTRPELSWSSLGLEAGIIPTSHLFSQSSLSTTVAQPEFSAPSSAFLDSLTLEISCETVGSEIRYTLDGSIPTIDSPLYLSPIFIDQDTIVRAKAFHESMYSSPVAGNNYTLWLSQPTITKVSWQEYPFDPQMVIVRNGRIRVEADSALSALYAELIIRDPSSQEIVFESGKEFSAQNSASIALRIDSIPTGTYEMVVRVTDPIGAHAEEISTVSIRPSPPSTDPILSLSRPVDGTLSALPYAELRIRKDFLSQVHLFRNGILVSAINSERSSFFDEDVALQQGQNIFTAVGYQDDDRVIESEELNIFYFPPGTTPFFPENELTIFLQGESGSTQIRALGTPDLTLAADLTTTPGATFHDLGMGQGRFTWNPTVTTGGYLVPVTASSSDLKSTQSLEIQVVPNTLYWQWMITQSYTNTPISQLPPEADADSDQSSNLFELAFLTDPFNAASSDLKVSGQVDDREGKQVVILSLVHRDGAANLFDFQLEQSPHLGDLEDWSAIPSPEVEHTIINDTGNGLARSEFVFDAGAHAKSFYRITVSPAAN